MRDMNMTTNLTSGFRGEGWGGGGVPPFLTKMPKSVILKIVRASPFFSKGLTRHCFI